MKYLFLIFSLLLGQLSFSQVFVGSSENFPSRKSEKISPERFDAFKNTTTIFTLRVQDYENIGIWEDAIRQIWTVTPFKIVPLDELDAYFGRPGYSFFTFGGLNIVKVKDHSRTDNLFLFYDLWMPNPKKKKNSRWLFSRVSLYADFETQVKIVKYGTKKKFSDNLTKVMYTESEIYNWGPGMMMGLLKTVNDQIARKETLKVFTEYQNIELIKTLKNDTLYVPDYVTKILALLDTKDSESKIKQLEQSYKYPIKFVTNQELDELLTYGRSIKYLSFLRCPSYGWVGIYDSGSSEMLYSEFHTGINKLFRVKDLKKIEKLIEK